MLFFAKRAPHRFIKSTGGIGAGKALRDEQLLCVGVDGAGLACNAATRLRQLVDKFPNYLRTDFALVGGGAALLSQTVSFLCLCGGADMLALQFGVPPMPGVRERIYLLKYAAGLFKILPEQNEKIEYRRYYRIARY